MKKIVSLFAASTLFFTACDLDDDNDFTPIQTGEFTVRVENIQTGKSFWRLLFLR